MAFRCAKENAGRGRWVSLVLLFFVPCDAGARDRGSAEVTMNLPQTVDGWTMSEKPRKILADGIFDYMDGAGEMYLAYRFKHLDVYEYASPGEDRLFVELYWMESSDDAFGLHSGDWAGTPTDLGQPKVADENTAAWPGARALYGSGLLRIWSGDLYVRILAFRETPKSKAAVMSLGRLVVAGRATPAPPRLLAALPPTSNAGFKLRPDRVCFLRSYLVLNSAYFLSTENILDLGLSTEAVTTTYSSPEINKDEKDGANGVKKHAAAR
jgi:hypothetical protein